MSRAVILFAKSPEPGLVKTRLIPSVGVEKATEIYRQLLLRNVSLVESVDDCANWIFSQSDEGIDFFRKLSKWKLRPQLEGDLGFRMKAAIDEMLGSHQHVLLMGADIADAQARDIRDAFSALEKGADIVIGPSFDGGYWLIGTHRNDLAIFENISWSSPLVFEQTLQAAAKQNLKYTLLAKRHDVDTPEDLSFI